MRNYKGSELEQFQHARNWKAYLARLLRPHISGSVLEVGAGIGATTEFLWNGAVREWVCLEPDPALLERVQAKILSGKLPSCCACEEGAVADLADGRLFDAILYVDVLEHVSDDRGELERASCHLKAGGRLVVLAPAFPWLFSPFDEAIGHHRRYTMKSLLSAAPGCMSCEVAVYIDMAGLAASALNRMVLRSPSPSLRQVLFWDRVLVPVSRLVDPLLHHVAGKSVLAVWTLESAARREERSSAAARESAGEPALAVAGVS